MFVSIFVRIDTYDGKSYWFSNYTNTYVSLVAKKYSYLVTGKCFISSFLFLLKTSPILYFYLITNDHTPTLSLFFIFSCPSFVCVPWQTVISRQFLFSKQLFEADVRVNPMELRCDYLPCRTRWFNCQRSDPQVERAGSWRFFDVLRWGNLLSLSSLYTVIEINALTI